MTTDREEGLTRSKYWSGIMTSQKPKKNHLRNQKNSQRKSVGDFREISQECSKAVLFLECNLAIYQAATSKAIAYLTTTQLTFTCSKSTIETSELDEREHY